MNNKEFSRQLELRTRKFTVQVIRLSTSLPNLPESNVVRNQITKSSSSVGANYREANRARSKADFANKIGICESEASETDYWLEVISDLDWADNKSLKALSNEAGELLAIFSTIGKNLGK